VGADDRHGEVLLGRFVALGGRGSAEARAGLAALESAAT
jgi:hypothetical protein